MTAGFVYSRWRSTVTDGACRQNTLTQDIFSTLSSLCTHHIVAQGVARRVCIKHVHPHVITCLSVCCFLVLSSFFLCLSCFYVLPVLCPELQLPCCRERRALNPTRTRKMRSIAPWRHTTLSRFYDPGTASSSGASHVPSQPLNIPSPRGMPCRDSGLPRDTRNIMGTSGNVFESLPAREGPFLALFENSRNEVPSSCGLGPGNNGNIMEHGRGLKRVPQSSSIPTPRFNQGIGTLNPLYHTGGTCSQNGVMDYPRYQISELHLGKFPDSFKFQSWKVNFKTEVCANSVFCEKNMLDVCCVPASSDEYIAMVKTGNDCQRSAYMLLAR